MIEIHMYIYTNSYLIFREYFKYIYQKQNLHNLLFHLKINSKRDSLSLSLSTLGILCTYRNSTESIFTLIQSFPGIYIEQTLLRESNGFTFSQPAHISGRWKSRDASAWRHYSGHPRHNTRR